MTSTPGCYFALGDSFSAGIGEDAETPWPEQVAGRLRCSNASLRFANLATVGATSEVVLEQQMPLAESEQPDLVSLICGANDVLLSVRPDTSGFERRFDELTARLTGLDSEPLVVTATYPDIATFLPLRPRTAERVGAGIDQINDAIRRVAERRDLHLLEWSGHTGVGDPENFAADDFHPSPIGHRRAAAAFSAGIAPVVPIDIDVEEAL